MDTSGYRQSSDMWHRYHCYSKEAKKNLIKFDWIDMINKFTIKSIESKMFFFNFVVDLFYSQEAENSYFNIHVDQL
ncbi:hypothetical protein DERF_001917 [Dermatophagoides farinae]|uniref:Uncharacterized protein n=1 Tax=Dermatophagoides farinae TaxID=6954 RepID=A0A922IBE1_DERFA|nr:hypothetical protein DERF_001917 [Dermatophagoides farinae]